MISCVVMPVLPRPVIVNICWHTELNEDLDFPVNTVIESESQCLHIASSVSFFFFSIPFSSVFFLSLYPSFLAPFLPFFLSPPLFLFS